ncbi:MAG: hypothetical protein ACLFTR_00930 [Candidatus Woesearchaeota archaeon]
MDEKTLNKIYNEVNMLNASIDIYTEFLQQRAHSKEEKKNVELKLELVKEEALKHNIRLRRTIDKLGY